MAIFSDFWHFALVENRVFARRITPLRTLPCTYNSGAGPCKNDAECIHDETYDDANSYSCECPPGFSGKNCGDINISDTSVGTLCSDSPCLNECQDNMFQYREGLCATYSRNNWDSENTIKVDLKQDLTVAELHLDIGNTTENTRLKCLCPNSDESNKVKRVRKLFAEVCSWLEVQQDFECYSLDFIYKDGVGLYTIIFGDTFTARYVKVKWNSNQCENWEYDGDLDRIRKVNDNNSASYSLCSSVAASAYPSFSVITYQLETLPSQVDIGEFRKKRDLKSVLNNDIILFETLKSFRNTARLSVQKKPRSRDSRADELKAALQSQFMKHLPSNATVELRIKCPVNRWDFGRSLVFSITTITTIGYGTWKPTRPASQIFCVIYARDTESKVSALILSKIKSMSNLESG